MTQQKARLLASTALIAIMLYSNPGMALAEAPPPPKQKQAWIPMPPAMAEKVRTGWKRQEEEKALKNGTATNKAKPKLMQRADASATEKAVDNAAAQAIKLLLGPDGKIQGIEAPDGTIIQGPGQTEEPADPTKVQPVQAAPRVYTPTAAPAPPAPNKTNQGGLGAVGGLGKTGSPNVK